MSNEEIQMNYWKANKVVDKKENAGILTLKIKIKNLKEEIQSNERELNRVRTYTNLIKKDIDTNENDLKECEEALKKL